MQVQWHRRGVCCLELFKRGFNLRMFRPLFYFLGRVILALSLLSISSNVWRVPVKPLWLESRGATADWHLWQVSFQTGKWLASACRSIDNTKVSSWPSWKEILKRRVDLFNDDREVHFWLKFLPFDEVENPADKRRHTKKSMNFIRDTGRHLVDFEMSNSNERSV